MPDQPVRGRLRLPRPPKAPVAPTRRVIHGVELVDEYAWLRAENWREALRDPTLLPEAVGRHLRAENRYAARMLKPTRALQRQLVSEMRGRIKEDDSSPPQADGPWAYSVRYRKGGQHPIHVRRPRDGGRAQVLLDGDREAKGAAYFDLGEIVHSPDHRLLAWSVDRKGSELHGINVRDLATGRDIEAAVADTTGEIVWTADSAGFFYVKLDADHRPAQVWLHRLGTAQTADRLVHDEPDPGMFVHIGRTLSGRFLVIAIGDHETSEARLVELAAPETPARLVDPRRAGRLYSVDHRDGELFILTNDAAEDFRIMIAPVGAPEAANWREFVAHRQGCTLLALALHHDWMIRLEREEGLPRLVARRLPGGEEHAVSFEDEAYSLGFDAGLEFDSDMIRFTYASPSRPQETYDYDLAKRVRTLVKRQEVPSGHDPARYVVRRRFAAAADGARVPVTILHRADLVADGSAPCLLYGYGAYGAAMPAAFRVTPLSLVDRGFVYAIAHVRGGSEKGRRWYLDGKREKKTNSFSDFIAAARMLAAEGFTSGGRIVAHGGSAGGLLMGAVANMAPALFAGIVADVPFVDALNTMLDETLPLTPPEWPEWGDPIRDAAAFATIRSYSPYDNVSAQTYPPMLVTAGVTDPRVTYWEPAKWVARLRARMTGGGPILLLTNMEAGHAGAAGRLHHLKETARAHAFAIACAEGRVGAGPAGA